MIKFRHLLLLIIIIMSIGIAQTTIAIIDFDAHNISVGEAATLTDRFRNELTKTNAYIVIERGKMEEILKEQGFQQSGCTSDECAVEIGQIIGVQQMVGGSIGKIGNVLTVSVRIIEVESGKIIGVANFDHVGDIGGLLTSGMRQVALDLISKKDITSVDAVVKTGDLFISTDPDGANLIVDNREIGKTPLLIERLVVGEHPIQLKLNGYLSIFRNVTIAPDKVDSLTTVMESIASLDNEINHYRNLKRRFFITSIGAVIVGVVFRGLADNTYDKYYTATNDADNLYKSVQIQDALAAVSFGVGIGTAVTASYYYFKQQLLSMRIEKNS